MAPTVSPSFAFKDDERPGDSGKECDEDSELAIYTEVNGLLSITGKLDETNADCHTLPKRSDCCCKVSHTLAWALVLISIPCLIYHEILPRLKQQTQVATAEQRLPEFASENTVSTTTNWSHLAQGTDDPYLSVVLPDSGDDLEATPDSGYEATPDSGDEATPDSGDEATLDSSDEAQPDSGDEARSICTLKDVDDTEWVGDTLIWHKAACGSYESKLSNWWKKQTFLIVGDSLSRRFAHTLAALIHGNMTKDTFLGEDKKYHGVLRNLYSTKVTFAWSPCINTMRHQLKSIKHDFAILSAGDHYKNGKGDCNNRHFDKDLLAFGSLPSNALWRTEPLPDLGNLTHYFEEFATLAKKVFPAEKVVHQQEIMLARSLGEDRITGNGPQHYGVEARLALVQHFIKYVEASNITCSPKLQSQLTRTRKKKNTICTINN